MREPGPVTYGEFPRMFAGFPPDDTVDLRDFHTMLAVIRNADEEVRARLIDRELLARHRDALMAKDEARDLLRRIDEVQEAHRSMGGSAPESYSSSTDGVSGSRSDG